MIVEFTIARVRKCFVKCCVRLRTATNGCETWTVSGQDKKKLRKLRKRGRGEDYWKSAEQKEKAILMH